MRPRYKLSINKNDDILPDILMLDKEYCKSKSIAIDQILRSLNNHDNKNRERTYLISNSEYWVLVVIGVLIGLMTIGLKYLFKQ